MPLAKGADVVIVDSGWPPLPFGACVLEIAHEFTLLGIDADDGLTLLNKLPTQFCYPVELAVTIGVSGTQSFLVDPQGDL